MPWAVSANDRKVSDVPRLGECDALIGCIDKYDKFTCLGKCIKNQINQINEIKSKNQQKSTIHFTQMRLVLKVKECAPEITNLTSRQKTSRSS